MILVVCLVTGPAAAALPAGPPDDAGSAGGGAERLAVQTDDEDGGNESLGPADHVYVRSNGNVVFVTNGSTTEETAAGLEGETEAYAAQSGDEGDEGDDVEFGDSPRDDVEFGLQVSRGLFYGLLVSNLSQTDQVDATGGMTAVLEPDRLTARGRLDSPRPESVERLRFDLEGARTTERAGATLDGSATVSLTEGPTRTGRLVERAETAARARIGPSTLAVDANASAEFARPVGEPFAFKGQLVERDGTYRLSVSRDSVISEFEREQWATRSAALATLQERYVRGTTGFQAEVTLKSYNLTRTADGQSRLQLAYTVEYPELKQRLEPVLAEVLAGSEELELSRAEASDLADRLLAAKLDRVSFSATSRDGRFEGSFSLRLRDYDATVLAAFDAARAANVSENVTDALDRVRTRFEAGREAGLVRTYTLDTTFTRPDRRTARFDVDAAYRTENWRAYVAALRERDVGVLNVTFAAHARSEGDRLRADASATIQQEALLRDATDQLLRLAESDVGEDGERGTEPTTEEDVEDLRRFLGAFRESDFRVARADLNVTRETVEVRFGGKFGDLSAFRPLLQNETTGENATDLTIEEVVVRPQDERSANATMYVFASDAVPDRPTEEQVRGLDPVTDDTVVHMPGTWDRSFPRMDQERAQRYLGLPVESPTPTPTPLPPTTAEDGEGDGDATRTTTGGGPGFTVLVALGALLAAALLALRRR